MAKYKIIPSSRTIVQSPISIGHKAEKGVEAIEFDLTAWVETYGSGTLTVIMRRWGDAIPYPIALEIDENNKATWVLSDIDTAKAGMAYAQLSYIVGDEVVKKSDIYTFRVMDSLTGEGDPPEAYESWLENLTHLAAEAMAEVLDIEGVVTDKTLTVDGGIADAKATGEALAEKADQTDYSTLSARVGANTIALAEKADQSNTYTKAQVDGLIEDVTVETDTTLAISGAPADAAETGRQIDLLKADLDDVEEEIAKTEPIFDDYFKTEQYTNVTTNNMTWTEGKYFDLNTGEEKSLNGYSHTDKFSCETGDVISIGLNTGQVLFWGADGYLLYVATSGSTAMQITAPAGATLYACNNRDVNHRPTETTVTKTWTEKVLKVTEYSAPARILYNSDAFINKRYANTANGNLLTGDSYASWYCVYKVPCEANRHYRTTTQAQVCFYNAQGTFISAYIPTMNDANISGTKVEMDFVTPNDCAFFSINSNYATETVFDLDYAEYGNSKSVYNLIGKTIVCFGDSITGNYRFGDNYPYQIEEKTGAKVYNVGFGGCRMELTNESSILYVNPFSMVSLADAIVSEASDKWSTQDSSVASFTAKGIVYKRLEMLKNIDFSQVDIITIAYGTNGLGLPLDDSADSLNTYTYAGATRYAIKTLLTKYPHLRIVLMTPIYRWYSATSDDGDTHQVSGQTLLDRVTKLLEVGAEIKIPTIDLYHSLGINKYNYAGYFGDDDETADGTHINSFGREQMGLRVAGELIRLM